MNNDLPMMKKYYRVREDNIYAIVVTNENAGEIARRLGGSVSFSGRAHINFSHKGRYHKANEGDTIVYCNDQYDVVPEGGNLMLKEKFNASEWYEVIDTQPEVYGDRISDGHLSYVQIIESPVGSVLELEYGEVVMRSSDRKFYDTTGASLTFVDVYERKPKYLRRGWMS